MSIHWMSWVWEHGPRESELRFTLLKLADNADQDGVCWPKVADIATKTCQNERTIQRHLKRLIDEGWIARESSNGGRGKAAIIRLMKPENPVADVTVSKKIKGGPNVTVSIKGDTDDIKRVTPVTQKGDTDDKTPTPPYKKNHQEPSLGTVTDSVEVVKDDSPPATPEAPQEFTLTPLIMAERKLAGTMPLNTGEMFPIYQDQVEEWKETFPAVDVRQQLREMKAWCNVNPKNRKTKKGVLAFVHTWLSREQDKGQAQGGNHGLQSKQELATSRTFAASSRILQKLGEGSGDCEIPGVPVPLLPQQGDSGSGAVVLRGDTGRSRAGATCDSVQPSSPGVPVLPVTIGTAQAGRRQNRGPAW